MFLGDLRILVALSVESHHHPNAASGNQHNGRSIKLAASLRAGHVIGVDTDRTSIEKASTEPKPATTGRTK